MKDKSNELNNRLSEIEKIKNEQIELQNKRTVILNALAELEGKFFVGKKRKALLDQLHSIK